MLPRNFGSEKIVRTEYARTYVYPRHVSGCKMAHFNTICVKLGIGHSCCDRLTAVKRVSADQCHMTASRAQVYNPLTLGRIQYEISLLSAYGLSIINSERHFLKHSSRDTLLALAKSIYHFLIT